MKKLITLLLIAGLCTPAFSQLSGGNTYPINGTQNPPTSFSTIANAASYLTTSGVTGTGDIILELQSGYSSSLEPATGIYFDAISGANASRTVILRPGTGYSTTISGTVAGSGLINLRGTRFLTIDGRQGGTGAVGLTLSNASTSTLDSTSTLKFTLDAQNDVVRYCTIQGAGKNFNTGTGLANGGVVFFGRGITTGNSFNTIEFCSVDGTANAHVGICSNGTATSNITQNTGDTIRGCNIYDHFNPAVSSNAGIFLTGTTGWVITGNSIYQTSPRTYTTQAVHFGIFGGVNWTSDFQIITNNYIGGSGPNVVGQTQMSTTGTIALGYQGIATNFGGTKTNISGNVIKNISFTYSASAGSFVNAGIYSYFGFNGATGIVRNNIVDSLFFNNSAGFLSLQGIYLFGRINTSATTNSQTLTCNQNTISNMFTTSPGPNSAVLYGIRIESNSAASITSGSNVVTVSLDSNIVSGIFNNTSSITTVSRGIYITQVQGTGSTASLGVNPTLRNNLIENFITSSTLNNNLTNPVAVGIQATPSITGVTIPVQRNIIRYLRAVNTFDAGSTVMGIYLNNAVFNINGNRIYDLTNASIGSTTTPTIYGLNIRTVAAAGTIISNNHIALGMNQTANVLIGGIVNNTSAASNINVFNNTVLINGTGSGTLSSAAFFKATETFASITSPLTLRNNLFINNRTGGTGTHYAIVSAGPTVLSGGNNTYIAADTSKMSYFNTSTTGFDAFVSANPGENYSYYANYSGTTDFSINPAAINLNDLFVNNGYDSIATFMVDSTNAACWLLYGKGITNTTLSTDFYGNIRPTAASGTVTIGAHQFNTTTTPPLCAISGNIAYFDSSIFVFAGRPIAKLIWTISGGLPSAISCRYYSGKLHASYPAGNVSASYWMIGATGGFNCTPVINYTPHETGTITNGNSTTKLAFYNGTFWTSLGAVSNANTTVIPQNAFSTSTLSVSLNSNSAFALTDNSSPIPVKLLSFNGYKEGQVVELHWITASEMNNVRFIVQRSADGKNFENIGSVNGKGNNSTINEYRFPDNLSKFTIQQNSNIFYRLSQIDLDGKENLSSVITIRMNDMLLTGINASASPNPFTDEFVISTTTKTENDLLLQVYDVTGKLVYETQMKNQVGSDTHAISELSKMQNGLYYLRMTIGGETFTQKMMKWR